MDACDGTRQCCAACCNLRRRFQLHKCAMDTLPAICRGHKVFQVYYASMYSRAVPSHHGDRAIVFNAFARQEESGWGKSYPRDAEPSPLSDAHDVVLVPLRWGHLPAAGSAEQPVFQPLAPLVAIIHKRSHQLTHTRAELVHSVSHRQHLWLFQTHTLALTS